MLLGDLLIIIDAAGTSRQAELQLDLPGHIFATVQERNPYSHDAARRVNDIQGSTIDNTQNPSTKHTQPAHGFTAINKSKTTEVTHQSSLNKAHANSKRRRDLDDFDGDDLELDDFLTVHDRRDQTRQAKQSSIHQVLQLDDADWLSIATATPSPPKPAHKTGASREDDWAAELGEQEDEDYDPIRLLNGKWACNHKCKDKTRFDLLFYKAMNKLMMIVANISVAGKAWISHPRSPESGRRPLPKRRSAN